MTTRARLASLALRATACLLVGASASAAIAWFCVRQSYWLSDAQYTVIPAPSGATALDKAGAAVALAGVSTSLHAAPGVTVIHISLWPDTERKFVESRRASDEWPGPLPFWSRNQLNPWRSGNTWDPAVANLGASSAIVAAGWPWPVLWGRGPKRAKKGWQGEFYVSRDRGWVMPPSAAMHDKLMPLRPLWIGLLPQAVMWGAPVFALSFVPAWIRATRRTRKGKCPACGYDLSATPAASPCPECGRKAQQPATPAA